MKKTLSLLLALLMLAGLLAACGEAPATDNPEEPTAAEAPTDETQTAQTGQPAQTEAPTAPVEDDKTPYYQVYGNELQNALVVTAQAMVERRTYVQYDDTRLITGSPGGQVTYRWQRNLKDPEDYTKQHTGYTNCAAFTYDCYYMALDYDIKNWSTAQLIIADEKELIYRHDFTGTETDEEKAAFEQEYVSQLEVGDIIVYRHKDGTNGHAMLYVGDIEGVGEKMIIHSSAPNGGNYDYAAKKEKSEPQGSIQYLKVSDLFDPGHPRYVFELCSQMGIVRPLNVYTGGVPEATKNRVEKLQHIVVQKLCSKTVGQTANPGDELTYTFEISNKNEWKVDVDILDKVPAQTTYVGGCDNANGNELSWHLTIPKGETVSVSYTVKINADAKDMIKSEDATANGVPARAQRVYLRNTYDDATLAKITAAVAANQGASEKDIELAKKIYTEAGLTLDLPDAETIMSDLFYDHPSSLNYYCFDKSGKYYNMVIPEMYGGYYVAMSEEWEGRRTRGPQGHLLPGDIAVCQSKGAENEIHLYMYAGENKVYDMSGLQGGKTLELVASKDALFSLLGYTRFVVLRPSMAQ